MKTGRILTLFTLLTLSVSAAGQDFNGRMAEAERLYRGYDFEGAASIYGELLKAAADSSLHAILQEKAILCENGANLIRYANEPEVVMRRTFSAEEFFLHYSHLSEGGWIASPNAFSAGKNPLYFEPGCRSLVFSAPDGEGHNKLYSTTLDEEGLWSISEPVERCTSPGNEIFPLVSASGKELFFSSDALAGMGGYDLFISRWNERRKRWEAPENLGFPYSSTGDDFLFSNTPDGEFTLLASNRDCAPDSVTVYVLRFENSPVSKAVSNPAEAARIARLEPSSKKAATSGNISFSEVSENEGGAAYSRWKSALERLESVRNEIAETRARLSDALSEQERRDAENSMMEMQMLAGRVADTLQALELDLIAAGGIPDYGKEPRGETAAVPAPARKSTYSFTRHDFGSLGEIAFEKPLVEDDALIFSIGETGQVVNEFPTGIVFQIQLAVVSNKMTVKQLRGIKPVFATRQNSGKYLYTAGAFRTYSEATAALPLVKKTGFSSAYIVAFKNGKSIAVSKARAEIE